MPIDPLQFVRAILPHFGHVEQKRSRDEIRGCEGILCRTRRTRRIDLEIVSRVRAEATQRHDVIGHSHRIRHRKLAIRNVRTILDPAVVWRSRGPCDIRRCI